MSTFGNNKQSSSTRRTYIAFSLLVSTLLIACPVKAQDASGLGLDQDSLLPPEVVPLDPTSASQMVNSQAQSRAADMASAPGLSNPSSFMPQSNGGSTAQDFRKDAFNSLYNQGSLPQQNPGLQGMQGQMGSTPGQLSSVPPPVPGSMPGQPQGNLGQSPWMAANGAPQQQTLSGGVQNPPSQHGNAKFNAAKHVLGTAAGFGGGMAVGAMMFSRGSSSPAAMMGMGLLGAGMLNYGLRNAFRF